MRLQRHKNPSNYQDPNVSIYDKAAAKDPSDAANEISKESNFAELEARLANGHCGHKFLNIHVLCSS